MRTSKINIKNISLRTIIGVHDWERETKQDILINISLSSKCDKAIMTDDLAYTCDYQALAEKIITFVEDSRFFLIETLAARILDLIMEDKQVLKSTVEIVKPHALLYAESVSIELSAERMP